MQKQRPNNKKDTSWEKVAGWYNKLVGDKGQHYHQTVVIPGVLKLLKLQENSKVLDLACGQGILARHIPKANQYLGIDLAPSLIQAARKQDSHSKHEYMVADAGKAIKFEQKFSHAACILALQNIADFETAIKNAANALYDNGKFVIVLNHPSFRIPRQSDWGIDENNKQQYRKVNRYLSPLEIPIMMNPGAANGRNKARGGSRGKVTWSYHHPLQDYVTALSRAGFVVTGLEEWASDKTSEGRAAKMENRARAEIPLFMAILAQKINLDKNS